MPTPYLERPEQWKAAADYARKVKLLGFDSETFGHDVSESSPAFRAKIHVWSIAFQTGDLSPYGFVRARGAVLPVDAVPAFVDIFEDAQITKVAHNAHHDQHSLGNYGIRVGGLVDTLDLVRLAYPERALDKRLGFMLKPLARDLLGKPKRDDYSDIVEDVELISKWVKRTECVCGEPKCRKRKEPEHSKIVEMDEKVTSKNITYQLESIVAGHKRWERLVEYAGADAIDALELYDMAMKKLTRLEATLPLVPW